MKWLVVILTFFCSVHAEALERVRVRIYSDASVAQVQIRVKSGFYAWVAYSADESVIDTIAFANAKAGRSYTVLPKSNSLILNRGALSLGEYAHIRCVPLGEDSSWVQIDGPGRARLYNGILEFRDVGRKLTVINDVRIDDYLGGVVESEAGHFRTPEFFKAQAVIARTWLLANINKHLDEGYNVKDDVSSQAYYSMAYYTNSDMIRSAVRATGDTILVDANGKPILGVFHANSGGQTANSQDAWSGRISYLQSVPDTFSLEGEKAFWEATINKEEFIAYVAQKLGVSASDANFRVALLEYHPAEREGVFTYSGKSLKWKDVRSRFRLRSAWFSITENGSTVLLKGRGFGHGVGMSQEGANAMATHGYTWKQILSHYYPTTRMVRLGDL
ncbi:SpoIID/LytB domain-containing protein [Phaeocystidibacter luteus]|uniref:SpoIID/LytB domain-containing protein n=1 Tax=Phaeocystidibacter luteus TaxID=911197 RepID=UPI0014790E67|nr:SpoIID/LytB domain-containing protein [Phaeocystidibacter luteus]